MARAVAYLLLVLLVAGVFFSPAYLYWRKPPLHLSHRPRPRRLSDPVALVNVAIGALLLFHITMAFWFAD